jgi:hypothetical protein
MVEGQILAAEQALIVLLFPPKPEKLNKIQRKKKSKGARKQAIGIAKAAIAFGDANLMVMMDGTLAAALPKVTTNDDEGADDDMEEDEVAASQAIPVSFGSLPFS